MVLALNIQSPSLILQFLAIYLSLETHIYGPDVYVRGNSPLDREISLQTIQTFVFVSL